MAEIVGVHGVKGAVKLKVFSDTPDALPEYAPLCDADEKRIFEFLSYRQHGNIWLAEIKGLSDRTQAEKMRGLKLYVPRDRLPDIDDEDTFYHADLIGLSVIDNADQKKLGKVITVANFGAGDLLDVKPAKGASFYIPFTKSVVVSIDKDKGEILAYIPPGLLD